MENFKTKLEAAEIDKLPDECLVEIFKRLSIADRLTVEGVSRRWQYLSQRSWGNFKYLSCGNTDTWDIKENLSDQSSLIKSVDFLKILQVSGSCIISIDAGVETLRKICHLLSNIRELQLLDVCIDQTLPCRFKLNESRIQRNEFETTSHCTYDAWQVVLAWIISHGENITTFKMGVGHSHYKEEDFARMFEKMKKLKSLHLYEFINVLNFSVTLPFQLPFENIQEIIFAAGSMPFGSALLFNIFKKSKKLQTLVMTGLKQRGMLEALTSPLASKFALTHLDKLDVSLSLEVVDDIFLEVVIKQCKNLTFLNLSYCTEVTDRGISSISNLQKLTYLNISSLDNIRKPPLENLTSLIVLETSSTFIGEECLCSLLKNAHYLRALNVQKCHFESNKLLNVAIEVCKTRSASNVLDLYAFESGIEINVLDEKPPLLNIFSSYLIMSVDEYGIKTPIDWDFYVRVISELCKPIDL